MADTTELVAQIAAQAMGRGVRVAVAESLTSGHVAAALGAGPEASSWFCGGVVAYSPDVKFDLLGVTPGPVNTARCAEEMARGALSTLKADVALGLTGVGGPGRDEGVPAGTVFIGCADTRSVSVDQHRFAGPAEDVLEASVTAALDALLTCLVPRAHEVSS